MRNRILVATGPESNGTKLLSRILLYTSEPVMHRSMPHGVNWWSHEELEKQFAPIELQFVVILRDINYAVESVLKNGHIQEPVPDKRKTAFAEQTRARKILLKIPSVVVVTYEELVEDPDKVAKQLSSELGSFVKVAERIEDGNEQYRHLSY